jgi:hypothetical protein
MRTVTGSLWVGIRLATIGIFLDESIDQVLGGRRLGYAGLFVQ